MNLFSDNHWVVWKYIFHEWPQVKYDNLNHKMKIDFFCLLYTSYKYIKTICSLCKSGKRKFKSIQSETCAILERFYSYRKKKWNDLSLKHPEKKNNYITIFLASFQNINWITVENTHYIRFSCFFFCAN